MKLLGTKSNRSPIGAQVLVRYGDRKQVQEVLGQAGFLSVNDRRLHFGLGSVESADVEIRWPGGVREKLEKVACDQLVTVKEGSGIVTQETFR